MLHRAVIPFAKIRRVLAAMVAVALIAGCARPEPAGPVVLAAASLQESMEAAADAWAAGGHPRPVLSFAGTPALARQIEAGAPADLFVSADAEWIESLGAKGLVRTDTVRALAGNRLVLIAPAANAKPIEIGPGFPLADALGDGRLAMADPQAVPAGRYGRQALESLGVWSQVSGRVAPVDSVRAALALVRRGEAPLGLVYATDARADPAVRVVGTFPEESHAPIRYFIAAVSQSPNGEGEAFRQFLLSNAGRAIFARHGFSAP